MSFIVREQICRVLVSRDFISAEPYRFFVTLIEQLAKLRLPFGSHNL